MNVPEIIKAEKWKRVTFLYTTGELFNRACIVNDLVMRSDDRELLWKTLRERNQQRSQYQTISQPDDSIDPSILDLILTLDPLAPDTDSDNSQTW